MGSLSEAPAIPKELEEIYFQGTDSLQCFNGDGNAVWKLHHFNDECVFPICQFCAGLVTEIIQFAQSLEKKVVCMVCFEKLPPENVSIDLL